MSANSNSLQFFATETELKTEMYPASASTLSKNKNIKEFKINNKKNQLAKHV